MIIHRGYPPELLRSTCFFATVRHPESWMVSASDFQSYLAHTLGFPYSTGNEQNGPLAGVPRTAVKREGCFMYDDLQSRHAAGGTIAYRRLSSIWPSVESQGIASPREHAPRQPL